MREVVIDYRQTHYRLAILPSFLKPSSAFLSSFPIATTMVSPSKRRNDRDHMGFQLPVLILCVLVPLPIPVFSPELELHSVSHKKR